MATRSQIFSPLMYIAHLTQDLKHRGSTTANETKASVYVRRVLVKLGVPVVESQRFHGAVKLWRPYILCLILGLLGAVVYSLAGTATQLLAALFSALGAWWIYREVNFEDNPARRLLPTGNSQNVIGTIPPIGETRTRVVLIGHLDSGQTPLLLSSSWILPVFVFLSLLTVLSLVVNAVLYTGGALSGASTWYEWSWIGTAIQAVSLLFAMEAELSPYTEGANDNASAVGVVLSLAQCATENPLKHTEIWTLLSGCEEVGCYGMMNFLKGYERRLQDAFFINLEGVGCGDIRYAKKEGSFAAYHSDPRLVELADNVALRRQDLGGRACVLRAGYTETGVIAKHGLRGITLLTMKTNGLYSYLPFWHQRGDVFERLDEPTLHRVREFVWEMVMELDREASGDARRDDVAEEPCPPGPHFEIGSRRPPQEV